jgi:hypothetical protein
MYLKKKYGYARINLFFFFSFLRKLGTHFNEKLYLGFKPHSPRNLFPTPCITVDEIRVYTIVRNIITETKQRFKQWKCTDSSLPKKAKTVPMAAKVIATVFWDSHEIILTDHIKEKKCHRWVLSMFVAVFERRNKSKGTTRGKESASSREQ